MKVSEAAALAESHAPEGWSLVSTQREGQAWGFGWHTGQEGDHAFFAVISSEETLVNLDIEMQNAARILARSLSGVPMVGMKARDSIVTKVDRDASTVEMEDGRTLKWEELRQ